MCVHITSDTLLLGIIIVPYRQSIALELRRADFTDRNTSMRRLVTLVALVAFSLGCYRLLTLQTGELSTLDLIQYTSQLAASVLAQELVPSSRW